MGERSDLLGMVAQVGVGILVVAATWSVAAPALAADSRETEPRAQASTQRSGSSPVTVGAVVAQEIEENDASAAIQARIDEISDDTDAMIGQYRASLDNTRQLQIYNRQLEGLLRAQEEEMASVRRQIDEVAVVGRRVMPHMEDMLAALEKFVELDMPFLLDERRERTAKLREMMGRADITISEKYRRILEAYQIENEYGRTIEAYRASLESDAGERTVDYLRIGRNALLYQTLDGEESGVWNAASSRWEPLEGYRSSIREGLRMARKQRAPDLIPVPMPAPEVLP